MTGETSGLPPAVFLIGPRAVGKSALGRRLARHLDWEFADADEVLEERHGRPIRDWLPADAPGFRRAESELLGELLHLQRTVIALGGGVVEDPANRRLLARQPGVIALRAPLAELVARQRGGDRPPLTGLSLEEEVRSVWRRRFPYYHEAACGRWIDAGGHLEAAWSRFLQGFANITRSG